uniref:BLOC-1-related complex subunit 7 n=1 Tax=Cynoglossus semilaevis TaxID=244447 RepID=A0A3P8WFX8_CYNSE
MASVESQSRFGQSVKGLLSDKVGCCSGDVIALPRQVLKGSRSQESLRKMSIITTHLQYQEAIQKLEHSKNLQDQLRHLLK